MHKTETVLMTDIEVHHNCVCYYNKGEVRNFDMVKCYKKYRFLCQIKITYKTITQHSFHSYYKFVIAKQTRMSIAQMLVQNKNSLKAVIS